METMQILLQLLVFSGVEEAINVRPHLPYREGFGTFGPHRRRPYNSNHGCESVLDFHNHEKPLQNFEPKLELHPLPGSQANYRPHFIENISFRNKPTNTYMNPLYSDYLNLDFRTSYTRPDGGVNSVE
jgi:hypothetical protein